MLTTKPLTILFLLCMSAICVSVISAVVCHDSKDNCEDLFGAPILALCCVMCVVALFSVFYVESMGHDTGLRNGFRGG